MVQIIKVEKTLSDSSCVYDVRIIGSDGQVVDIPATSETSADIIIENLSKYSLVTEI